MWWRNILIYIILRTSTEIRRLINMDKYKFLGNKNKRTEKLWLLPDEKKRGIRRVHGIVPDIHLPYDKKGALKFLEETFIEYGVTDIIIIGDLVDLSTVSTHGFNPNGFSPISEYERTLNKLKDWFNMFPVAKYILGNHDNRIQKVANQYGIPGEFVKSFRELFKIPDKWEIGEEFIIDKVNYSHGLKQGGQYAAAGTAKLNMMSSVIGHYHAQGGITYLNNGKEVIFGLSVGALVDDQAIAFQYGKWNKYKAMLGCGIVISDKEAYFIPMRGEYDE